MLQNIKTKINTEIKKETPSLKTMITFFVIAYIALSLNPPTQSLNRPSPKIAQASEFVQTAEIEPLKVRNDAVTPTQNNLAGIVQVEAQKADTQAEMGNPITSDRAKQIEVVAKILNKTQSPISPERWVDLSTELDMPLDFLLTVALNESNFGTKGRAVATKNIYNVGNTDCGDGKAAAQDECNRFIESWELGVYEFAKLIKNCYFDENETIKIDTWIDRDFRAVRCNFKGKRYMSDQFSKFKYKSTIKNIRAEFTK